jgi:hypothetical protein
MRHPGSARSERIVSRRATGPVRPALALGLALVAALALTGCSKPAAEPRPPIASSAAQEGSGTATTAPASARPKASASGVDPQAAASIENSVSDAESLLRELNQDFQQDAAETS